MLPSIFFSAFVLLSVAGAQPPTSGLNVALPNILPLREQADLRDRWLEERLDQVVPALMRRSGVDLWLIVAQEYDEDPVMKTMLPATWLSARRRTVLVFSDTGSGGVDRFAVSRYEVGRFFPAKWDPKSQPDQWRRVAELIAERNPRRIAINRSADFSQADGLSSTEYDHLMKALPAELQSRVVSGEALAVGWMETRIPAEMAVYPLICRLAHRILAEGLSESAIVPGSTTTADLEWWYRERIRSLGIETWFHPSVSVQRAGSGGATGSFASEPEAQLILPGDLVHVDLGITYLGLNTDNQQHAYVLRPGETNAPAGLQAALRAGNRLQDILMSEFKSGLTGNAVLAAALGRARAEGLEPSIYSHPLGYHGHAAGPTIGLWDQQNGVPGAGDYPFYPNTAYSIELNVTTEVPEWGGQPIRIMLEEDAFFDGSEARFIDGRQTRLWLVPRSEARVEGN